jgi:NAD-dependent SIR2 family protein deacetylase
MCGVRRRSHVFDANSNSNTNSNESEDLAGLLDINNTDHRHPTSEHLRRSAPTVDEEEDHLFTRSSADPHHGMIHVPHGFDAPLRPPAPMKPPIVFFGEGLPAGLLARAFESVQTSDLVIVLGTSLKVAPMNLLPKMAPKDLLVCNLSSDVQILCPGPSRRVCHLFGRSSDDVISDLLKMCANGTPEKGKEGKDSKRNPLITYKRDVCAKFKF